jgi:2,4-dienoyl-CoA reductase-like NADH-dependent reductase (Old Yellow Enzyme family)
MVERVGPSDYKGEGWKGRAMSIDEINSVVKAFGDAADRAMEAGFDGVQIHGAHGYLVSQFLSRMTNKRTDEYGGSFLRRIRFLEEVYDELRSRVGCCIPVMLKMNCDDFTNGGFSIDDSVKVAKAICKRGIDSIEISGGGLGRRKELRTRAKSDDPVLAEASFSGHAVKIRKATKPRPMALVDRIRSFKCMKAILAGDIADLISMSRPFIREPDLVHKLKAGQERASCITCDSCRQFFGKEMMHCALE